MFIYNANNVQIDGEFTVLIKVESGIRQENYLSPLLFNITMDEIIGDRQNLKEDKMGNQRPLLCKYNFIAETFKMAISAYTFKT